MTDTATSTLVTPEIIAEFEEALGAINVKQDSRSVDKLSKDYYWYSPLLKAELEEKKADFAVKVDSLDMLKSAVKLSFKHGLPISIRGGGTGNYGQMIPLYGGVLLDLSRMDKIHSVEGGVVELSLVRSWRKSKKRRASKAMSCVASRLLGSKVHSAASSAADRVALALFAMAASHTVTT